MKKVLVFVALSLLFNACGDDEPNSIQLAIQCFELNQNCFSAIKLQQEEVVITNADDYHLFEDSIRVNWFPSCDTIYLPIVDFDSSFFVGKYTQVPGCSVSYESQVQYIADEYLYNYEITVDSAGTCEMLHTAFNCAIIPRKSDQINVQMEVKYR